MLKLAQLFAFAALFVTAITPAGADEAKWAREANDRAEIQALMWRYVRALDTLDVDAYPLVFTEDAQFGTTKGREGLKALIAGVKAARERGKAPGEAVTPTYQLMTNVNIEFLSETRARLQAYFMAVFAAEGDSPPRVATAGHEVNELVKVDGQWLIAVRTVSP